MRILKDIENNNKYLKIREDNLRNWKFQSDMGAPVSIKYLLNSDKILRELIWYFYRKIIHFRSEFHIKRNIIRDLDIIKISGALEELASNPVDLTPGKSPWYAREQFIFNERWLRYIYLSNRMLKQNMINDKGIWVDIGPFYGGLQSIIFKKRDKSIFVLVDFKHQLLRSYIYLSTIYPEANHYYGEEINFENIKPGSFVYLSLDKVDLLDSLQIECVTNFFSFGEMKREYFDRYTKAKFYNQANNLFLVNRVVSSPFFEKTYDSNLSIIDYKFNNHEIRYFDIFPIHHYSLMKRELFGKKGYFNVSSPYFEMYLTKL